MSATDGPGGRDDRTRRVPEADPDATRQLDVDATRRVDQPAMDADPTRQLDATGTSAYDEDDGYVTVPNRPPPGEGRPADEVTEVPAERNRGRDWAIGLGGVVAGVLLAVIVAFLAGGDEPEDGDVAAAQEQVAALEAERDELVAQNEALEARATEAEAVAGEGDADLEALRAALDERAAALDERNSALDSREGALEERASTLDARESELDQREADVADREAEAPTGDGGEAPTTDGGGGGIELPEVDTEEVEGFLDSVFDRIRDLF